jgi:hypothetical protein
MPHRLGTRLDERLTLFQSQKRGNLFPALAHQCNGTQQNRLSILWLGRAPNVEPLLHSGKRNIKVRYRCVKELTEYDSWTPHQFTP